MILTNPRSFFLIAVQKGRIPKSPLEGSMVDQFGGLGNTFNGSLNGGMQNHQNFMSAYTNLLLRADSLARIQQAPSAPFGMSGQEHLYEMAARLLFNAVDWARNVPFFSALASTDQVALLRNCWSELYILSTAQHCSTFQFNPRSLAQVGINSNGNGDTGTNGMVNGKRSPDESSNNQDSLKMFEDLIEKFKTLQTDAAEFSCLKALVLFNPGMLTYLKQGGHCPGDQEKVSESEKERGRSAKSQGILTVCPNVKVSPLLKFNLIAVSAIMVYQEVKENSLRSRRS